MSPLAVNATFVLSGLLGLQFQVPDGSGKFQTLETSIPFNISPNITVDSISSMNRSPFRSAKSLSDDFDTGKPRGSCGRRDCNSAHEICVTWQYDLNPNREFKECLPSGDRLFSTKSNPVDIRLCPEDQTHSIIYEPRECLKETPPCELKWRYKCVNEDASPHSCKLRKCPEDHICLELIHCERQPPCVGAVECHHISDVDHQPHQKG